MIRNSHILVAVATPEERFMVDITGLGQADSEVEVVADCNLEVLADFLEAAENSGEIYFSLSITAYKDEQADDGVTLALEEDFENDPEEANLDDVEGSSDYGDLDEE